MCRGCCCRRGRTMGMGWWCIHSVGHACHCQFVMLLVQISDSTFRFLHFHSVWYMLEQRVLIQTEIRILWEYYFELSHVYKKDIIKKIVLYKFNYDSNIIIFIFKLPTIFKHDYLQWKDTVEKKINST